ncbi:MAG: quinolinate synthase NadA [Desulfobulbaceae bacterium]|nr:quinolinate synthase NadA [Desulfobulbaceae bacterium]HIJ78615.1 quinolinate synthase NadA [Deltaproteobacteria bacterium]
MTVSTQVELGSEYLQEKEEVLMEKIAARKKELGGNLLILGHHYQQEATFRFADLTGDSLKLARNAAEAKEAKYIVFCGVHFMAESADILTADDQVVILPDLRAGCPMADMATREEVDWAWQELAGVVSGRIVPVTYVNSSALIKDFVGGHGGSVCTSSNAERVLTWALSQGEKVLFFPDEHLGRNSAAALGIAEDEVVLWQREKPLGGNTPEQLRKAKVLLWDGYCTVHMQFEASHVTRWREKEPRIRVIVHPECRHEVVRLADQYGSTEAIIKAISDSPAGSKWAIGTEINLVNRLKAQHPDKEIHSLSPFQCLCSTMYRIKPAYLLWVLDNLVQGRVVNRITVPAEVAEKAKLSLDRMLEI